MRSGAQVYATSSRMSFTRSHTCRKPTFRQAVQIDCDVGSGEEGGRGVASLGVALCGPGQHHVASTQTGPALGEREQGSSRTDLDVIRVGADRQDRQGPFRRKLEMQGEHDRGQRSAGR